MMPPTQLSPGGHLVSLDYAPTVGNPDGDADLADACLLGCPDGLSEFHRRYFGELVELCHLRLGDRALAEDIASNTILRAVAFLPSFERDRPLWPWLRTIAVRQCANQLRRRRYEHVPRSDQPLEVPEGDRTDEILDQIMLDQALDQIPPRQRLALTLHYLHDLESADAARALGVTRNAFDQLLARGRVSLAAAYRSSGGRGLGLVGILAWARQLGRRGARGTSAVPVSVNALLGGSLATAAGLAAILSLNTLGGSPGTAPQTVRLDVNSAQSHPVGVEGVGRTTALTATVAGARTGTGTRLMGPATAHLSTFVTPSPLGSGVLMADRLTVRTPVGTLTTGGSIEQSSTTRVACAGISQTGVGVSC